METLNFDVVIVGGGPAGSTCALGFVNTGLKVAVVEKSKFPREKVCGDGVGAYVPKALNMIDPEFAKAFWDSCPKMNIGKADIYSYDGKSTNLSMPEDWFIITRYELDNFLYKQASALPNVSYLLEEQVTFVSADAEKAVVQTNKGTRIEAKMLIACDGASSFTRRAFTQYKPKPEITCIAVRAYYSGVKNVKADTFEMHFSPLCPQGYLWVFPSFNGLANVGFGTFRVDMGANVILRDLMLEIIEKTPSLKERFKDAKLETEIKGWSIPLGYETHPVSGDRYVFCGDAASIADPSSGEGIGQAIVTGRIAAFQAKKCFEANNFSATFMKQYDRDIENKFGRKHKKRARYVDVLTSNQWMLNSFLRLVRLNSTTNKLLTRLLILVSK